MSEKRVNIKITASTTEFNNAMKKAQKEIEGLAEAIDALGSSKIGDKLEEQFDGLIKAAKKVEQEITDMLDSLDDLGKAKLGKVEDQLDDISEAGKKLNNTLEDTTDSIEDIDKSKFNKLESQFKDIVDSGKDFNEKVEGIIDLLDKVDKQDLNGLENEFDQVKDALEKISKETRDSTDDMEKRFREVTDEVGKFIKELNDVEDTKLENLEESIKDIDKYIDEAKESVSDFNKETNDLDDKELNDYLDALIDVTRASDNVRDSLKKAFGSLDGKNNLDFSISGKGKDGLVSNIAEGLVSGTVAGNKLEKAMEGVADSISDVAKNMEKLDDAINTKSIDELGEEYKEAENAMEKLTEEYDDLIKKQEELKNSNDVTAKAIKLAENSMYEYAEKAKELGDAIDKAKEAQLAYTEDSIKLEGRLEAINDAIEEQKGIIDQVGKEYDEATEKVLELTNAYKELEGKAELENLTDELKEYGKQLEEAEKKEQALADKWGNANDRLDDLEKQREAIEQQKNALDEVYKAIGKTDEEIEKMTEEFQEANKMADKFQNTLEQLRQVDINEALNMEFVKENFKETAKEIEKTKERMAELNKEAQGHADDFDKQYKAYEKLSQKVKEYLEDEENGILLREKVAKSFREVSNSMEAVYKDASKLNNADIIDKTLLEAAEHLKELNLVSTENLQADLKRLGEVIEDKTEKIKRFKELNKEFGSEASKAAYGLDKQAKDIRDWANSADFAIEAAETLTNAWGDLSAAGEDHQKIRERTKYIEDFGEALEKNVAQIRNNYKELQTLDEIYEQCTDKERGVLEDYKMWEKNKDALLEYNRAITDYMRTLKDTGGEIDSKFLDELGNFSPQKFIDNFEKMGAASVVLSKQINAVKLELLENIKQYKENAEAARENAEQAKENAEAAVEEAKANQKAAKTQEERKEATEKLKKAKEDLINATKKLDNVDNETLEGIKDQIKEYNRLAEAMREIGMAAQDLGKADIAKFNKSLASMLDNLDTFENDLPKTFADIKEDIKALFTDMEGFDLSGVWDGLKDIGAGVLDMIPDKLKLAAGEALALAAALKQCAEWGVDQFTEGLDTVKGALSGLVGLARDVGQEIRDAFENITGMQMDFSSLIEIPINFESQMAKVGAIAGVDKLSEDFKKLEEEARRLGATTRYSATEVAEAMEYMAMAGWGFDDIMRQSAGGVTALESVLHLATVASMDLGQASDFVTDGLTALGYEADSAAKFVDILAAASTSSNTSVAQMQRAFTNCAPVAGTLGITMEDLSIALGLMADKGVKGAKAGTALKNLMANMSAPTEKQLAYMEKFNLIGAQQAIVNGDLVGGLKQFKAALAGLTPQQQNAIITTIAGKEALSGISALLNTTEEDLAELESAIRDCDGAAKEMADNFDDTVKGALLGLASAMQERLLQVFDKTKDGIKEVTKQLTEFFNIWNGFSAENGSGLADALLYLEKASEGWGQAIANNLEKAIASIDNFINGGALDSVLQIGTNIINGIADGIQRAADNGTLQSAITGAIRKIGTWFADNLETVVEVGEEIIDAISQGIEDNSDVISRVIIDVINMQTKIDNAIAKEKWKVIGANLATFITQGFQSKAKELFSGIGGFLEGLFTFGNGGINQDPDDPQNWTYTDPLTGNTYGPGVKNGKDYGDGVKDGVSSKKEDIGNSINNNFKEAKVKTDTTASEIGQGISDNIVSKLETMDTGDLAALREEMLNLQKTVTAVGEAMSTSFATIRDSSRENFVGLTNIIRSQMTNCTNIIRNQMVNSANIVRNQCVNMANIFRNQFVSMANVTRNQMVNVSNIVRNQAVSWSNIISNQVTNARNTLTSQFLSMAAVARTQMVNISNIIRNQAVTWSNIISNQAKNARDNLTRQFISMAKVVATQMKNCLSSVNSYMSKIASATNKKMTMSLNVNKTVTTSFAGISGGTVASAMYAANNASTYSLGGDTSALTSRASAVSSASSTGSSNNSRGGSDGLILEIPVMLDGKEVARATARYVDNELKTMASRENRKRGAK